MSAGDAGEAYDGVAGNTCAVLPLSLALSVELTELVSGVLSSLLLQAPNRAHKDMAISALAKRLRCKAAVGFDRTDMKCLRHGGRCAKASMCPGQRCARIVADLCNFCEDVEIWVFVEKWAAVNP